MLSHLDAQKQKKDFILQWYPLHKLDETEEKPEAEEILNDAVTRFDTEAGEYEKYFVNFWEMSVTELA